MFIYFWFPNYLFEALTFFSWMTWIAPNNHNLNILAGFQNGLGVSLDILVCAFTQNENSLTRRYLTAVQSLADL